MNKVFNPKGVHMNDDFNKNMQIITGANPQNSTVKQLTDADKKKISDAYFSLFFNLTFTNWIRGGNLGNAWYKALSQIKQFVGAKQPSNPATMYMRQICAAHNARWAQVMMTNKHRDDVLDATPEQKQQWNARTAQNTTNALKILNDTVAAYTATQQKDTQQSQASQSDAIKIAAQKMQMMILMQMRQKQNGGMVA